MSSTHDPDLGMSREITRRDFLNGVAIGLTGSVGASRWARTRGIEALLAGVQGGDYYPPALTGMRGSHVGSFEVAHALRDGRSWDSGPDTDTGERYDLVVVGGGISGLSAAWFFRAAAGADARILILDNHDDFGGHAKRNEFSYEGQTLLINGGTLNIEAPGQYSAEAAALLREIGIDRERFRQAAADDRDRGRPRGLGRAFFFDHETFGEDRLVPGYGRLPWSEFVEKAPLSEAARRDLVRLNDDASDFETMPELRSDAKKARLARISYRDYLIDVLELDSRVADFYQSRTHGLFCVGIDAIPALFCWEMGYPGFQGMALEPTPPERLINQPGGQHGREDAVRASEGGPSIRFADGNATITRLLVGDLIPESIEASSMEGVVIADLHYDRLDVAGSNVRIRLNSTAVRVAHRGDPADSSEVEVTYVRDGTAQTVRAAGCVMACYNGIIPYLCPELPAVQREALEYAVKAPIVYTSVLLREWSAFQGLGVSSITAPGAYHTSVSLDFPTRLGDYQPARTPRDPVLLHMVRTPCSPGLPKKQQHLEGQRDLHAATFETFELNIREDLSRMLSGSSFDPAHDVVAITVNRWPHGYAYTYNTLDDPIRWALESPDDRPNVVGRKPFGRIAIANSDAAASPHTDAAINEAYRAVQELL